MRPLMISLMVLGIALSSDSFAKGGHASSGHSHYSRTTPHLVKSHAIGATSVGTSAVERDARGRIKRSTSAKNEFKRANPCPSTGKSSGACPGYVIDHVQPLKRGGADAPSNMQWQTVATAKAKDRVE